MLDGLRERFHGSFVVGYLTLSPEVVGSKPGQDIYISRGVLSM